MYEDKFKAAPHLCKPAAQPCVCVGVCVWHLLCLAVLWRRKGRPGIETASLLMPTEEPDILRSVDTTDALKSNPEPLIGT